MENKFETSVSDYLTHDPLLVSLNTFDSSLIGVESKEKYRIIVGFTWSFGGHDSRASR
ncbi:hypothetical protein GCM10027286_29080 [Virgibacillus ainsalahensis]